MQLVSISYLRYQCTVTYSIILSMKPSSMGGVVIFAGFAYLCVVYVTSMNILYSLLTYNCLQSENKHAAHTFNNIYMYMVSRTFLQIIEDVFGWCYGGLSGASGAGL